MIPTEVIEEIKYRCDIVEVISGYVQLKRAGSNYNGLCPFHSEKSPSFTVFPSTRSYYCFGCGAGGDVVNFIRTRENLDYRAAVELLAARSGVHIPEENTADRQNQSKDGVKRERILEMNREAAKFFHSCLYSSEGAAGLQYLTARGLSGATIRHFGLGFAPNDFGKLTNYLSKLGYTAEEMRTGFLCGISQKGYPYDYFRNRVMFPIINTTGNVVAFGGRVMDDSKPKYLNSSDTPAFKKSHNLFALNFAKSKCKNRMILCEGYMDVIACHANGFEEAVATLGTAITPDHARMMKNYTEQVIIAYDSDEAGQNATAKAMKLLAEVGLDVKVLKIPNAKDPDEFMKANGVLAHEKFKLLLDQSRSGFDFKLESVLARHDISVVDEKVKAADKLCRIISEVYSEAEREVYIGVVSERLSIPRDSLKNDVKRAMKQRGRENEKSEMQEIINMTSGLSDHINHETSGNLLGVRTEENILGILMLYPENLGSIKKGTLSLSAEDFCSEFSRGVFVHLLDGYDFSDTFDYDGILGSFYSTEEISRIHAMAMRRSQLTDNGSTVLSDLIRKLREITLQKQVEDSGDTISAINRILQQKRGKMKS